MTESFKVLASTQFVFPMPYVSEAGTYVDVQTRMMRVTPQMSRTGLNPDIEALLPEGPIDREVTVGVAMLVQMRRVTWRRGVALWLRDLAMWIEYPPPRRASKGPHDG
jgi:hypothetical protein